MIHKYSFYPYHFVISIEDYPMIFSESRSKNTEAFLVYTVSQGKDQNCIPECIHAPLEKVPPSVESTSFSFLSTSIWE